MTLEMPSDAGKAAVRMIISLVFFGGGGCPLPPLAVYGSVALLSDRFESRVEKK